MNRIAKLVLGMLLVSSVCSVQATIALAAENSSAAIAHGSFPVKITKALDSSKLREGDAVELETTGSFKLADGTLVPKGSKVGGHVTASKARSRGDADSELTVSLDKLEMVNGKQLPIKGVVQAVFPPAEDAAPMMAGKANGAAGGGYGGGPGTGGTATVGTITNAAVGSNTGSASVVDPADSPKAEGVQGMRGLDLEGGVLRSKGKSVKLGNGVRMIVHADILE